MRKTLTFFTLLTVIIFMSPNPAFAASAPTFADTPNITLHGASGLSDSFTYTVPSGSNQVLVVFLTKGNTAVPTISQNGVTIPVSQVISNFNGTNCDGTHNAVEFFAYLAAPTTGTFSISWAGSTPYGYGVMTVNGASQSYPIIDSANCIGLLTGTARSVGASVTATSSNVLLLDWSANGNAVLAGSHGSGQTEYANATPAGIYSIYSSYITGSTTAATLQGMSETVSGSGSINLDMELIAITPFASVATTNNVNSNWFQFF